MIRAVFLAVGADADVEVRIVLLRAAADGAAVQKRIRAGFPLDLIVRSPQTIRQRIEMDDYFITEILGQGETLYEGQHARVG